MNNTTLISLQENIQMKLTDTYDTSGAIIFIVGVLVWYSLGVVCLLRMQTISSSVVIENSSKHSTKLFNRSFREKRDRKIILEELVDKENRDKLWDIYFGTSDDMNNKIIHKEPFRIRNIQRRLEMIDKDNQDDNERIQFSQGHKDPDSKYFSLSRNKSSSDRRLYVKHHSLVDRQTLEEWEKNVDSVKISENYSLTIPRLFTRRHSRR
ncbi:unnamed protein product [Rotaria sordida]|uniref:Uncharacterized protein n=1 Tax=Rotaria sordida TaxID=392033 RepID=A0A814BEY5_9BILA|nr:unnamed protein product [Rotaria sordida]CAF0958651.1 unnamed protein product [Rotaria sordida]CAF0959401.1 unnamed protein product [Rotaria sordida]CAF1045071.1 unnamed protein product [Rotaria sordida]CAF3715453.1 unnamed protein product [Rotaria sordida]